MNTKKTKMILMAVGVLVFLGIVWFANRGNEIQHGYYKEQNPAERDFVEIQ